MVYRLYSSITFRLLSLFSVKKIKTGKKEIYLTFDDGPEPEITESVLSILNNYNAKATFFCTGKNAEKYPGLLKLTREGGHATGNHSYSHINGLKEKYNTYINDVNRSKELLQSNLFRPPWGMLTLKKFLKLKQGNKIILWGIDSKDTTPDTNWEKHSQKMVKHTRPGSIVLFHFCKKHSHNTLKVLPLYLEKLKNHNYGFGLIRDNL